MEYKTGIKAKRVIKTKIGEGLEWGNLTTEGKDTKWMQKLDNHRTYLP